MESCVIKYKKIFDQGRYSGLLELADAKIRSKDECLFDVHRVMLARCSEFFRGMFCGIDKDKKIHDISNIDGDCLSDVLVYIYTEEICVNETNIEELLCAADYLSLRDLYVKAQSYVNSTLINDNCLSLCMITHLLSDKGVFRCCLNFIIQRFEEIVDSQKSEFNVLPLDLLKLILNNRNLFVKSESIIWQAIVQWVQADSKTRLEYVGDLLSALAIGEISSNLAAEIVQHDIIHNNVHMKELKNAISFTGIDRAGDAIINFLKDSKPHNFGIPEKLTLVSESGSKDMKIFVSFDETVDLWHNIIEIPNFRMEKLEVVKSKIYFFERNMKQKYLIFDLETMEQILMENTYLFVTKSVIAVDNAFYAIVWENKKCHINRYDFEDRRQLRIASLDGFNFPVISATTIGQDIFMVARNHRKIKNNIVTCMFNVVTYQFTELSSPIKFHTIYKLVSYRNKIYLINPGSLKPCTPEVEVFDPAVNVWKVLPHLHNIYYHADLIILSDKLIVYDHKNESKAGNAELWNEDKQCWEVLEKIASYGKTDSRWYYSYTINDTELIKNITKRIRNSKVKMEEIHFLF